MEDGWGIAQFIDERAVAQNGEVICLRSHSKVGEERVPAFWTEFPFPWDQKPLSVCAA